MGPTPEMPRGYFEDRTVSDWNNRLLSSVYRYPGLFLGTIPLDLKFPEARDSALGQEIAHLERMFWFQPHAYKDPRFKAFGELPEDGYEAFLSAPLIARNRVVGVINVQHRLPHQHSGDELELLATVGEQVGCVLELARLSAEAGQKELALPVAPGTVKN